MCPTVDLFGLAAGTDSSAFLSRSRVVGVRLMLFDTHFGTHDLSLPSHCSAIFNRRHVHKNSRLARAFERSHSIPHIIPLLSRFPTEGRWEVCGGRPGSKRLNPLRETLQICNARPYTGGSILEAKNRVHHYALGFQGSISSETGLQALVAVCSAATTMNTILYSVAMGCRFVNFILEFSRGWDEPAEKR